MLKAVFFDLDNTLIDSEEVWVKATWLALANKHNLKISYDETNEIVYGKAWNDIYTTLCELFPGQCGTIKEMEDSIEVEYRALTKNGVPPIPGSVEALRKLSEEGKMIAIVSGSPSKMIYEAIQNLKIYKEVKFYLGSEDYSPGKPSPKCFLMAVEKSGFLPEECLVIEDSTAGITAAKNAGLSCIAIRSKHSNQDAALADLVVDSLEEVDFSQF